jgi:phosphoglucosamine mutase
MKPGYDWKSDDALKQQINKVENDLANTGRVLIRASGTEPLLRIMVETKDDLVAMNAAKSIADLVPTI